MGRKEGQRPCSRSEISRNSRPGRDSSRGRGVYRDSPSLEYPLVALVQELHEGGGGGALPGIVDCGMASGSIAKDNKTKMTVARVPTPRGQMLLIRRSCEQFLLTCRLDPGFANPSRTVMFCLSDSYRDFPVSSAPAQAGSPVAIKHLARLGIRGYTQA